MNDLALDVISDGSNNVSNPYTALTAAIGYEFRDIPVSLEAGRTYIPVSLEAGRTYHGNPGSMTDFSYTLKTAYDKISVVIDTRGKNRVVYVVNETDIYLMGGVEILSAVGIKNRLKAAITTENYGEFYVVGEGSGIVKDYDNDPFFDVPNAMKFEIGWQKDLSANLSIGIKGGISNGNSPQYYMDDVSYADPELFDEGQKAQYVMLTLNLKW